MPNLNLIAKKQKTKNQTKKTQKSQKKGILSEKRRKTSKKKGTCERCIVQN